MRIVAQQCECILNLTELKMKMVTMIRFYVTYILPQEKNKRYLPQRILGKIE